MVSLLIITHNNVGQALLDAATSVLGSCPITCEILSVVQNQDSDVQLQQARNLLNTLNKSNPENDGILVITDMYGSTPSNIATKLGMEMDNVTIITGINLPMMVRIMNYPDLPLDKLAHKAVSGGQSGVIIVEK